MNNSYVYVIVIIIEKVIVQIVMVYEEEEEEEGEEGKGEEEEVQDALQKCVFCMIIIGVTCMRVCERREEIIS